jgi:Tfp pilus assembly protein PilX
MVLIVSLLLLLVATVVGITALSTSTTKVMIAGNQRLSEMNFSSADGGISASVPIIETTAYDRAVSATYSADPDITISADFTNEITGALPMDADTAATAATADIRFALGSTTVSVDVDYLYASSPAGSAIEFASGYEGFGKGAGSGGAEVYYTVNSLSEGDAGSESGVYAVYRYVTK